MHRYVAGVSKYINCKISLDSTSLHRVLMIHVETATKKWGGGGKTLP